jgi:hypothetical protein
MDEVKMSEQAAFVLKALCFIAAAVFVLAVVSAQLSCSQIASIGHQCGGSDGIVWVLPFFFAPIGIPALVGSIVISIVSVRRYIAGRR